MQETYGWGGVYGALYQVAPKARLDMVFVMQMLPNRTDIGQQCRTPIYQALIDAKP